MNTSAPPPHHGRRPPSRLIHRHSRTGNRRRDAATRHGTVAVEFAIVAPILFLFFFAAFEFSRVAMIRHTADNAAYEGARQGIIPGATRAEVEAEATRVLSTIGITVFDVDVTPRRIDDDTREVTVRVTVPVAANSFVPAQYFIGQNIRRELTMVREGQ